MQKPRMRTACSDGTARGCGCIRRAVGEERTERTFTAETSTLTTYRNQLTITIRDYTENRYEGTVIYERTVDLNDEIDRELEMEKKKLWRGI